MMQAASDIFLGWTKGVAANRYLYWRQLRDMKASSVVEAMGPAALVLCTPLRLDARPCARPIRRPDRARAYLGKGIDSINRSPTFGTLRRPERGGLSGLHRRRSIRPARCDRGHLSQAENEKGEVITSIAWVAPGYSRPPRGRMRSVAAIERPRAEHRNMPLGRAEIQ